MYVELVPNEDHFIRKIVTDKYTQKYDQFKKRIQKQFEKMKIKYPDICDEMKHS